MKKFSEIELWKDVSPEEWKNWKWQLSHCINTLEELEKTITISDTEAYGIKEATKELKMRISPHIALMMANGNHEDTLRKQFIPSYNEVKTSNVCKSFFVYIQHIYKILCYPIRNSDNHTCMKTNYFYTVYFR